MRQRFPLSSWGRQVPPALAPLCLSRAARSARGRAGCVCFLALPAPLPALVSPSSFHFRLSPPLSRRDGHILVNIRRFTGVAFKHLDELVERDMLNRQVAAFLRACIRAQLSIIFAGPPGSGKTTLMSCCTAELDPSLRVVIAEEVFETDVPLPNVAHMQTRPARMDRREVDLRRLVNGFLRMAPDIAIVGEVRDREALPLLLTLSSGVKGYTTIHAGSARQALTRLRFICQLSDSTGDLPQSALNSLVSESVDVVVMCARGDGVPRVVEVAAVEDLTTGPDSPAFTVTDVFGRARPDAPLTWSGNVPVRVGRAIERAGFDIRALLDGGAA
jgi:pilus assembly protein CpaF